MAEFIAIVQQDRNQFIIQGFEFGVGINIKNVNFDAEFGCQRTQRQFHFLTEMAIRPRDQRKRYQSLGFLVGLALDRDKSLQLAALDQQGNVGRLVKLRQQLVELIDAFDLCAFTARDKCQNNIARP